MIDATALLAAAYEEYQRRQDAKDAPSSKKAFLRALYELVEEDEANEEILYETFTGCFKGKWPKSSGDFIVVLLHRIIRHWEITPEDLVANSHAEAVIHQGHDEIDDVYSGAWLTIQFRTKKDSPSKPFPPNQLRVGILVYGQIDEEDERRRFTEVGVKTIWSGDLYRKGNYLYYRSYERSSTSQIYEKMNFFMNEVYGHSAKKFHYGIRVGTAFEEYSNPLIFASPLLMWKIPEWSDKVAPLNKDQISELRNFCAYVPNDLSGATDQFGLLGDHVKQALKLFTELGERDGKPVDPIFVL